MTIGASNDPRIMAVEVTDDLIIAHLADGRTISVPLVWSWRLSDATPAQRQHFEITGTGQGVYRPGVKEPLKLDSYGQVCVCWEPSISCFGTNSVASNACLLYDG
jgi:hypothetical protein